MPRTAEPWDWPPPKRGRSQQPQTLEGKVERESVRFVRPTRKTGWNSPAATKASNGVLWFGIQIIKVMIAIPLALIVCGAAWLFVTLLTLAK